MADGGMPEQYWYNVRLRRVETVEDMSPAKDRLGPYPTREEAERALEKVQERNEQWDAADDDWDAVDED
ncbi:SPOR domain-containing protein [Nocardioides ginkgobilobae]|jgi:hypothetical protein